MFEGMMQTDCQKLEAELRRTQRDMEVLKRELRLLREGKAEKEPRWVNVTGECSATGVIHTGDQHQTITIRHKGKLIGDGYRLCFRQFPKEPISIENMTSLSWIDAIIVERRAEE